MSWKTALVFVLAFAVASCSKEEKQAPSSEDEGPRGGLTEAQANEVLAKIGDRTITVGEFADRLSSQSPYLRARFESPERRKEFLDNLIRFELLVYEAKRRGYADGPEIKRASRTVMIQQLIKKEVDEELKLGDITDEEIQTVYDANPGEYDRPAQVRASAIFIEDRGKAEKVLAQARKADINEFRGLAREKSEDENAKNTAGDLQFFTKDGDGAPPKAVRDAAFSLDRVGSVYGELVEASNGYYIVMLTGKRAPLKRTYEQAKRAIRHKLAREKKDAAMEALLERLRNEVEIEIDYDALKDVRIDQPNLPQGL